MTNTDIVTSIDQRLTQAKAEIARLEGARHALSSGDASPGKVRPRKVRPRTTQRRSASPPNEVVPAGKLAALLDGSTGMSTAELAKATGGRPDQILALLRELEKDDQIRRTGERRSTRWHLITDEDRIAARSAEIAAQSKRRSRKAA
jgi:predicted Rossmann fold nucleotide-binding protein DprA/Smf involved in DNA uptake